MNRETGITQTLLDLEQRLFQPDVRHSREEMAKLLAEDFIEIGSSGKVYDRNSIIEETGREEGILITLSSFNVRSLSNEIALVTYRAAITDTTKHNTAYSIRSSIWNNIDGNWRMVFHQGTPTRETP